MSQHPAVPSDDRLTATPPASSTDPRRTADGPARVSRGAATTPAVLVVTVLGTLLTGLFVVTADRWESSTASRVPAVVALVTALTGVLVAVAGQVLVTVAGPTDAAAARTSGRTRRGVAMVLLAATLSVVAVLSTGVAALVSPQRGGAGDTEPTVTVRLAGGPAGRVVSGAVSFPAMDAGATLDVNLVAVVNDTDRVLLGRTLTRAGRDGSAVAEVAATLDSNTVAVTLTATTGERSCATTLSVDDVAQKPALTCRD